jgi:DtxR family Mn-dependent transcriptional regulator
MLPSSTVENYLKAIYQGVGALTPPARLLPMGQLASALGVAPGTATTMVKALAESGLVEYEPYTGVTLSPSGQKLAALVLRRHRLVELFLVRVMGYSWDEVHEEAEQLEHVVSDRLIDRIDEMLGRPEVDPHGDPIPNSEGLVKTQDAQSLLTCPVNVRVTVTRVIDQDKSFLRFIEQHNLKPGESIEVEDRDPASDSVRVRGQDDRRVTIGTKAASKLLVVVRSLALFFLLASPAAAQSTPVSKPAGTPFRITDNSFLVEEAFNQEPGIFQNVLTLRADENVWLSTFTQEWPLFTQRHQLSYTLTFGALGAGLALGDTAIHYRLQLTTEHGRWPAISPRFSVLLATGSEEKGLTAGEPGYEINIPVSKQFGDLYVHANAGFVHYPDNDYLAPKIAGSAIWRLRPMVNVMFEAVSELVDTGATREAVTTISPGLRTGWNRGDDTQFVIGIAAPVQFAFGRTDPSVFAYFSYELPFSRR